MTKDNSFGFMVSAETLRPLVRDIVVEVLAVQAQDQARLGEERLAWSEPEAAQLLGLQTHQLRDERLRGRISASLVVGRRIRYQRADLLAYLQRERVNE